ncbi:MAG: hypothetical protein WDM94_07255 [Bauldia sp.]
MIEQFVRPLISGKTPLYGVTKLDNRVGGSYLVNTIFKIATGASPANQGWSADAEEQRKAITTSARNLRTLFIDNVRDGTLIDSNALARRVSEAIWEDRLLGSNESFEGEPRESVVVVGVNLAFSNELAQRWAPIALGARTAKEFRHSDRSGWLEENRPSLIHAVLTLVNNWIAKGEPSYDGSIIEGFGEWAAIVGGILEAAGIEGFLSNLAAARREANAEGIAIRQFATAWLENDGFDKARHVGNPDAEFSDSLVTLIEDRDIDIAIHGHDGPGRARSLAKAYPRNQRSGGSHRRRDFAGWAPVQRRRVHSCGWEQGRVSLSHRTRAESADGIRAGARAWLRGRCIGSVRHRRGNGLAAG